jgi:uncharacterized protein DUF6516
MSAPLDAFVYALAERHPLVTGSTLTLAPIGATLGKLEGRVECKGGVHLEVWELIDFGTRRIRAYSYEVYQGGEKICWYDSWAHPEIPALAATFPHHRHVPPNLRDHRVPAPGISFDSPNLDVVLSDLRRDWVQPRIGGVFFSISGKARGFPFQQSGAAIFTGGGPCRSWSGFMPSGR